MRYTIETQNKILELFKHGYSGRRIARELHISKSGVNQFLNNSKQRKGGKGPRVLLFDLETSAALVYAFGRHKQYINQDAVHTEGGKILVAGYRWLHEPHTRVLYNKSEIRAGEDYLLCAQLWDLFNEADVVVAHNCVTLDTPILTADLTWKNAGDLKVGDSLVGFDEGKSPFTKTREKGEWKGVKTQRKIKHAIVTDYSIHEKDCVEVLLSNGDKVVTTKDHYWLGKAEKDQNLRWYTSESLRQGQRVIKYMNTWEPDISYEAGWLSGFIDGEGSLQRSTHKVPSSIQFCQRPGVVWDKAIKLFEGKGIDITQGRQPKTGGLGRQDCLYANTLGGKWGTVEIIGKFNIERLKQKIDWDNFGTLKGGTEVSVVSVTPVGIRKVAVMGTSSSTFFASGYAMHNCKNFDVKMLEVRCLANGLPPLPTVQVIDTLEISKKKFRFPSNKLDSLAAYLGVGRKVTHSGIDLWVKVQQGDEKALGDMVTYCEGDVDLLHDVFLALRSRGLVSAFNAALYYDDEVIRCRSCGHTEFETTGRKIRTATGIYNELRCTECETVQRDKQNQTTKTKRTNLLSTPKAS